MEYLIHQVLDITTSQKLCNLLLIEPKESWQNGKETAGSHSSDLKNNIQLDRTSSLGQELSEQIKYQIRQEAIIKSFCLPRHIHGIMFTRTTIRGGYGAHIDNAYMSSARSDLSFTIFLNSPAEYEGGELCIETMQESKKIKLPAGQCVIYPSTSLHSVETVTKGERIVCVGWIQSYIKSNEDRNLLFSLDAGARSILAKHGRSDALDLVFQAYGNLLRRLGD